jgi:hypothetical protein
MVKQVVIPIILGFALLVLAQYDQIVEEECVCD